MVSTGLVGVNAAGAAGSAPNGGASGEAASNSAPSPTNKAAVPAKPAPLPAWWHSLMRASREGCERKAAVPSPQPLLNGGNTCFMNATLQALLACPSMRRLLLELRELAASQTFDDLGVVNSFLRFFAEIPSSAAPAAAPSADGASSSSSKPPSAWGRPLHVQPLRSFDACLRSFRLLSSSGGEGGGAPGTQEDAEEWLGFLLDQMHEEMLASARTSAARAPLLPPSVAEVEAGGGAEPSDAPADADAPVEGGGDGEAWQTVGKNNKVAETTRMEASDASPITCIFGGQLASRLESRGAAPGSKQNKPSITIEPFQCLNVDIKSGGVVSLEDAITGLCSPEWIDGVEMEKGQPAVRAQRQYLIRHPPPVLILHLKRFSHDAHGAHKLSKPLRFTDTLTLKPTVLAPASPSGAPNGSKPSAPTYRLFAVIAHHGQTMRLGHYTCDVRCTPSAAAAATAPDAVAAPTDDAGPPAAAAAAKPPAIDKAAEPEWFHCDDSTVHRVPLSEVLRRQAYVLFYERLP